MGMKIFLAMSTALGRTSGPSIGSAVRSALRCERRLSIFDFDRRHPQGWVPHLGFSYPAVFSFDPMALVRLTLSFLGPNTPGVDSTKPGKAASAAEETRPWLLLHHGCVLSKHGWVKPVRFSMVRCPKRLRVKTASSESEPICFGTVSA